MEQSPRKGPFEVERERRWRIWALFGALLAVALVAVGILAAAVSLVLLFLLPVASVYASGVRWYEMLPTVAAGALAAVSYWYLAQRDARRRLLQAMHAQPLDPRDRYHQRLANIVDELRLASGERGVECVVVPALGMNAFAFSDLRGGSVVGVTEGAVSRLSRSQLEGVVAHEFAHVASGSHVTTTVACLLFGIYASMDERVDRSGASLTAADVPTVRGGAALVIGGALLAHGVLTLLGVAAAAVNGALSRQREFAADLAAARYTRDPLSLAMALRTIARHPAGGGYIPPGLAPLCIRADEGGPLERAVACHPPMEARLSALLSLANMGRAAFEEQARQMDETFAKREHFAAAPAPAAQAPAFAALSGGLTPGGDNGGGARQSGRGPIASSAATAHAKPVLAACPACGAALSEADYEGPRIHVCRSCGGRFVTTADVARIIARREMSFTAEQQRLAEVTAALGDELRRAAVRARFTKPGDLRVCPACGGAMVHRLYSYDYAVEIDSCVPCDACWFDRDELEVLQILAERRVT